MKSNLQVIAHFRKSDPQIFRLIGTYGLTELKPSGNYFPDLIESVINQQLSNKAAATIWKRFRELFLSQEINPETVIKIDNTKLRSCGTSNAKAQYIHNIARAFIDQTVTPLTFNKMTDMQIIDQLIKIKGIGRWTAEMFLIFSLGREDVFSMGDAGLNKAMNIIYGKDKKLTASQKEKIITKWKPYRSYASLMLWKSLDNK
jgi:DNA-3-methyladenine glycosylase II